MKALIDVNATAEQLALFSRTIPGVQVIRGAAGSGKTTTALLKLKAAIAFYKSRIRRSDQVRPVRVLVLTFNRTLRGYISELAKRQVFDESEVDIEVSTFSSWACGLMQAKNVLRPSQTESFIAGLVNSFDLDPKFLMGEVNYVLGRFPRHNLVEYLSAKREGRGSSPRMERGTRESLIAKIIEPYYVYKSKLNMLDFNDLAVHLCSDKMTDYDVVVVDETQDFSANEVRAILNQVSPDGMVVFVLDSAQRIYAKGFSWSEVGVDLKPENSHKLKINYRNTKQIAAFAAAILSGMTVDDDGSLPGLESAIREGALPVVLEGPYLNQLAYAIECIKKINLDSESVAFFHPKGWFRDVRPALEREGLLYAELTGQKEWPDGDENIALSTLHSAKGLEFDHVFIIGIDGALTNGNTSKHEFDHELHSNLRRLVAMGVGRARRSVTIGFKENDVPWIADFFTETVCKRMRV